MTTSVMPEQPTAPVENDRRIIPIFANLMPAEVVDNRRSRRARRMVLTGLVVLIAVVGGLYTLTLLQTASAQRDLDSVKDQATQLSRQQNQFADVVRMQDDSKKIEEQLAGLMASDLRWSRVLSAIRGAAPSGVRLSSVSGTLTPKQEGAAEPADAGLPSTSAAKPVGTIAITGVGPSKPVIAEYVDRLAKLSGVTDPYLASITDEEGGKGMQFSLRLTITDQAFGGRFTKPGTNNGSTQATTPGNKTGGR